jgi:signal peptide peptidase SppA
MEENCFFMNRPMAMDFSAFSALSSLNFTPRDTITDLPYNVRGGTALIPIRGILSKENNFFSAILGTTSYEQIQNSLTKALADREVENILLDIDSFGGDVSGLFDLVDFIYESRETKPIFAVANDHAFSAAYAIASAASKIFVNRTSGVGSIGVIATHVDVSEMDKKEGVKYTSVFAGDHKNDRSPHAPLSEDATKSLQKEVNRLYDIFVETVSRNRKILREDVVNTRAQVYYGQDAIGIKLVDEILDKNKTIGGNVASKEIEDQMKEMQAKLNEVLEMNANLEAEILRLNSQNSDEIVEQKLKMATEDNDNAKLIDDIMDTKLADSGLRGESLYNKAFGALGIDSSKIENKREAFGVLTQSLKAKQEISQLKEQTFAENSAAITPVNLAGKITSESLQEMRIMQAAMRSSEASK